MSEPLLKLKRVEDPSSELVSRRWSYPDRDDLFELVVTDSNGGSITLLATRDKMRKELIRISNQIDRE